MVLSQRVSAGSIPPFRLLEYVARSELKKEAIHLS
jgi:hypothetical protein